jgi:hypothetical protein
MALKQQSRQRYAASGFAFVPHTVPLRHRWVVETGPSSTIFPFNRDAPNPTEKE